MGSVTYILHKFPKTATEISTSAQNRTTQVKAAASQTSTNYLSSNWTFRMCICRRLSPPGPYCLLQVPLEIRNFTLELKFLPFNVIYLFFNNMRFGTVQLQNLSQNCCARYHANPYIILTTTVLSDTRVTRMHTFYYQSVLHTAAMLFQLCASGTNEGSIHSPSGTF